MAQYVQKTWPFPLGVAGLLYLLAQIGSSGEFKLSNRLAASLGTATSAWGLALLIVWIARSMGRLRNDGDSIRAVWIAGLVIMVLWFVGATSK